MTETAGPGTAEEALTALARDLVEEIAAGRALQLAQDDPDALELASFNVRAHLRRSPTGKVEQVREHTENRFGTGIPGDQMEHPGDLGHIPEPDWLKGERDWTAKGEAIWKKNEWKSRGKPKTADQIADEVQTHTQDKLPDADSYRGAAQHLDQATDHLLRRGEQSGQLDQNHLARAYHELGKAHDHIVRKVLPHAKPEEYPQVAEHLQKIAGHMQDLDRAMGANPELTRKTLGDFRENFAHAGEERRAEETRKAEEEAQRAAGPSIEEQVGAAQRDQELRVGQAVEHTPTGRIGKVTHKAVSNQSGAEHNRWYVQFPGEGFARNTLARELIPAPEPKKGAAAVHPQLHHATVRLPGDTISGHAHAHVPKPFEVKPPDARDKTIAELHDTVAAHRMAGLARIEAEQAAARAQQSGIPGPGTYAPLTDEEYARHAANVENAIDQAYKEGLATSRTETVGGNRHLYKPERAAVHKQIVSQHLARAESVPSEGRGLMMGGLGGAGKSTVLKNAPGIDISRYAVVNPDDIKEELAKRGLVPHIEGLSPMEASSLVHDESSHVANLVSRALMRRHKNVAFDITMSGQERVRQRLEWFQHHGYRDVQGVFVDIPAETSVERAQARHRRGLEAYRQGQGLGGRYVPSYIIRSAEYAPGKTKNRVTFDKLRGQFSSWQLWDNSGAKPKLIDKTGGEPAGGGITSVEDLIKQQEGKALDTAASAASAEHGPGQPAEAPQLPKSWLSRDAALQAAADSVQLDPATEQALKLYSGLSGQPANQALREGNPDEHDQQVISGVDQAFAAAKPLTQAIDVWRTAGSADLGGSLTAGGTLTDKAFLSTTASPDVAEKRLGSGQTLLHIVVPAGLKAIAPPAYFAGGAEKEILLPRGTRLHVLYVGQAHDGTPVADVIAMPPVGA